MIFHGRINRIEKMNVEDGELYEVRMTDCCRPVALRTGGEFIHYITGEKRKAFPQGDQIVDTEITIQIREMKPGRGGISLKGQALPGIVPVDKLSGNEGKLPEKPKAA